jgi:hypothetical protein
MLQNLVESGSRPKDVGGVGIRADGGLARAHNLGKIAGRWFLFYHLPFLLKTKKKKLYHTIGRTNVYLIPSPARTGSIENGGTP